MRKENIVKVVDQQYVKFIYVNHFSLSGMWETFSYLFPVSCVRLPDSECAKTGWTRLPHNRDGMTYNKPVFAYLISKERGDV